MQSFDKLPWFKFFPRDWIALVQTSQLSAPAEGCFIRLLCHCWINGTIPRDRARLAVICDYSGPELDRAIAMFTPKGSDVSQLYSPRLETEREDCIIRHMRQSQGGKKAMRRRYSKVHKLSTEDYAAQ